MTLKAAVRVCRRVAEVGREAWDACATNPAYAGNPFIRYDFLHALEESNCATERTGWGPQHLAIEDEQGAVAAVMPLYLKSHSQGEYIFDHAWAEAYERAGGRYYPKLLSAAPFTPATGARFLARPDVDTEQARKFLLGGALTLCERYGASSFHVNFPTGDEWRWMGEQGLALREGQQYHWENRGYATFDDFLGALSSGRRKTIRRERRDAGEGLEILCLTGEDLTEDHWDAFFGFYMDNGSRKWGRPYLSRPFFSLLGERMADKVLLLARKEHPLAGRDELSVTEVLDETFVGLHPSVDPAWAGFWSLDDHRGGSPPHVTVDRASNPQEVVASLAMRHAIIAVTQSVANVVVNLMPGVAAIPLHDAEPARIMLVGKEARANSALDALLSFARARSPGIAATSPEAARETA